MADNLETLALLTGLDTEEDEQVLTFALNQARERLLAILNSKAESLELDKLEEVPEGLSYIVLEVAVKRIRRIGSEGLASEEVEGHRRAFNDASDDFSEFMPAIDAYFEAEKAKSPYRFGGLYIW